MPGLVAHNMCGFPNPRHSLVRQVPLRVIPAQLVAPVEDRLPHLPEGAQVVPVDGDRRRARRTAETPLGR